MCGTKMDPMTGSCVPSGNKKMCPCKDTTSGQTTSGVCVQQGKCEAKSSGGQGVDSMLSQLGQMLGKAMEALKGGGGGGGGGGQPPQMPQSGSGGGTGTGSQACTSYYQVSTPSSDPCAYYVPNIANDLNNTASDLSGALNGNGTLPPPATTNGGNTNNTTGGSTSGGGTTNNTSTEDAASQAVVAQKANSILGFILNPASVFLGSTTQQQTVVNADGTVSTNTSYSFFGQGVSPSAIPGLGDFASFANIANIISGENQGGLQLGNNGVTITSSSRDANSNTAVSGFYGADTIGGVGVQGLAAWLCRTRPWASSIFSKIVSVSYFDNLCTKNGYQVGGAAPVRTTAPVLTQTVVPAKKNTPATTTQSNPSTNPAATTVPPHVQVWAVPAIVSIGSRTSVFWSARGVESCIVTSPDGSFHQSSLSGGASTVPLTSATTYSISCLTAGGTPATDYFTVKMAI
ncbi:hypothetical protein HZC00_01850 [Candidatus Kaiserbacteria bacterium]|nr:hypothetical protein [Candidatus Kaiserbacteria bacterium]